MALNTSIRGLQIRDAFFGDGIKRNASDGDIAELALKSNAGLAIDTAELKVVAGDGLDTDATGVLVDVTDFIDTAYGLTEDTNNIRINLKASAGLKFDTGALAIEPDDIAGAGLVDDGSDKLAVNVDDSSIEITSGDVVQVKALGITNDMLAGSIAEAKLDIHSAPTDGYVLYWNDGEGKLDYKDIDSEAVVDGDILVENLSTEIDLSGYAGEHTLAETPVANSVQVFLNGLLQEEGSGKDYTISGATFTFETAPESGDILIVHYIKASA